MGTATAGVEPGDAGAAGAAVNAVQQVGGSLGAALLSTLAVSATADALTGSADTPDLVAAASVHGYTLAFWVSGALIAAGATVSAALLAAQRPAQARPADGTDTTVPAAPILH